MKLGGLHVTEATQFVHKGRCHEAAIWGVVECMNRPAGSNFFGVTGD